jgi:Zn ribbon nucleic-acid-binding protein
MATNPKILPCPCCGSPDDLNVYKYDSGWCYVECDSCWYRGPGEGSIRQAIKSHNEKVAAKMAAYHGDGALA